MPTNDVPVEIVAAAFTSENGAKEALDRLKALKAQGAVGIKNAAVLRKDENGKLRIGETGDLSPARGGVIGGVVGAGIGLLAGPALLVPAAIGALIGGLAGKLSDSGFPQERLKQLGENLTPDSSAIIAVVEHTWVKQVEEALQATAEEEFTTALGADMAEQLEAGHDVAYSALATQGGFAAGRVAGNDDESAAGVLVADDTGASGTQFYATKDGFVARGVDVDSEGNVTAGVAAGVPEPAAGESVEGAQTPAESTEGEEGDVKK